MDQVRERHHREDRRGDTEVDSLLYSKTDSGITFSRDGIANDGRPGDTDNLEFNDVFVWVRRTTTRSTATPTATRSSTLGAATTSSTSREGFTGRRPGHRHGHRRRQNVFTAANPVRLTWFTDQHFFHRLAATTPRAHLDAQLRHLVHLAESGVLNLRIVPTGDPSTIPSPPFYLLAFDDGRTCAYERGILATQHTNDPDDLAVYNRVVDSLDPAALDAAAAVRWLQNLLGPRGAS